jgi:hypothetical protein
MCPNPARAVAQLLKEEVHRRRRPLKEVVNDALRRGLAPAGRARPPRPYRVKPHETGLCPGIDERGFNRLADELDDEAVVAKSLVRR